MPCECEPGDLNWENIGLSRTEILCRNALFTTGVLIAIALSCVIIYYAQTYMAAIGVPVTGCASIENLFVKNNTKGLSPSNVKSSDINTDGFLCYISGKANNTTCNATIPYCTDNGGTHNTNCTT